MPTSRCTRRSGRVDEGSSSTNHRCKMGSRNAWRYDRTSRGGSAVRSSCCTISRSSRSIRAPSSERKRSSDGSIGRWVLAEACREAVGWRSPSVERSLPYVSVNVAGSQLQHPGFVQDVRDVLRDTGLPPARLVLEVTESALIEDTEGNVLKLEQLRDLGIRLAIDDFGTGCRRSASRRRAHRRSLRLYRRARGRNVRGPRRPRPCGARERSDRRDRGSRATPGSPDLALLLRPGISLLEARSGR